MAPGRGPPYEPKAVRIRGQHFRPEVQVAGGRSVGPVTYHRNDGQTEVIEVVPPVRLLGEVERIAAALGGAVADFRKDAGGGGA